ncbi:MAG: hypothetical protein IKX22_13005 [Prevotella sp.]|nr:hypothetical protein [Prevotella sp.]
MDGTEVRCYACHHTFQVVELS